MPNDYSRYGFVPDNNNYDYSKYGFVPDDPQEQQTKQEQPGKENGFGSALLSLLGGPTPRDALRLGGSIIRGMALGGQTIQNLPSKLGMGKYIPADKRELPDFGVKNPNMLESFVQNTTPYAMLGAATGGLSSAYGAGPLLSTLIGGAASGSVLSEDGPGWGALEGAALGGAGYGAGKAIGRGIKTYGKLAQSMGSKNPLRWMNPGQTAEQLRYKAGTQNKEYVEGPAKAIFQELEDIGSKKPIFTTKQNTLGDSISYKDYRNTNGKIKSSPGFEGNFEYMKIPDEELGLIREAGAKGKLEKLHEMYIKNPQYKEARLLERQMGEKIKNLTGTKNPLEEVVLNRLSRAKSALTTDIENHLEGLDPETKGLLKLAKDIFSTNAYPLRTSAEITKSHIHSGKIDKKKLYEALKKASSDTAMDKNPIPYDVVALNDILGNRLAGKKWGPGVGLALGAVPTFGWSGYHLLRKFIPGL